MQNAPVVAYVRVETPPAGSIRAAVTKVSEVAQRLRVPCICRINGVELPVPPSVPIDDLMAEYERNIRFEQAAKKGR